MLAIPASNRVKKRLFFRVLEFQISVITAIVGLIDTRAFAVPDTKNVSGACVKRLDIAKIQFLGSGHGHDFPGLAAVRRAKDGPAGTAGPDDFFINDRKAAQAGGGIDFLFDPLSVERRKTGAH